MKAFIWNPLVRGFMFMFFIMCVSLQHNDADPWTWVVLYTVAAAATIMTFWQKCEIVCRWLDVLLFLSAMAYLGWYLHLTLAGRNADPMGEVLSEIGGLLLVALWFLALLRTSMKES